jgi:hypothetical protein
LRKKKRERNELNEESEIEISKKWMGKKRVNCFA